MSEKRMCPNCGGVGQISFGAPVEGYGDNSVRLPCGRCGGSGEVDA